MILSTPLQYISGIPPATRIFAGLTVASSALYFWVQWQYADPMIPYLVLVPGSSLFFPWTLLTAGLVETNIIELVVSLVFIPPSLRYLERLWGSIETVKFIVVTITISNVIAFGMCWLEFLLFRAPNFLYGIQWHGQTALQAGVLVAFTQLIPEHQIQILGVFKVRVKSIPMAYNTFSLILSLFGIQSPYMLIQFGWLVSYVWLRFYKKNTGEVVGGGSTYGDRSETFAFIIWFPPFAHRPITILSETVYNLATRFHLIPNSHDLEMGYTQVPGGARAEAERRRAMALKALDQRVAAAPTANAPTSSQGPARSSSTPNPSAPPAEESNHDFSDSSENE